VGAEYLDLFGAIATFLIGAASIGRYKFAASSPTGRVRRREL
jgi:hypothetical protein